VIRLEQFVSRNILSRIRLGLQDALYERGSFTVEDGYALLDPDELAIAKTHQLGNAAVRELKREMNLRRIVVEASPASSRKGGYIGRWTR
jgi:hypothetical protein